MKEGFIFGSHTPITPAEGLGPNTYATSDACLQSMKDAKIQMVRTVVPFPFTDETMTETTADYKKTLDVIRVYCENGIETMAAILPAEQSAVDDQGLVSFIRRYPEWLGSYDNDFYFEVMEKAAAFIAKDLEGMVTYWQIGNENDADVFIGSLTFEQNCRFLETLARGVKSVNPNAMCGITLAGLGAISEGQTLVKHSVHPYAEKLITALYRKDDSAFDYIGIDGYFGSWSAGGPEDWTPYIDRAYEVSGKPVLINEWGYSSLQRGKPRPKEDQNRRFNSDVCRFKDWDALHPYKWLGKDHSPELQAQYLAECLDIFLNHPHCIGELFFQWQDMATCWQCGDDDCPSETAWGCIDKFGNPKPAYYALKKYAEENR